MKGKADAEIIQNFKNMEQPESNNKFLDTPNGEKIPIVYGENEKNSKPVPKYTSPGVAPANTLPENDC